MSVLRDKRGYGTIRGIDPSTREPAAYSMPTGYGMAAYVTVRGDRKEEA